ncbi:MAG: efflux RND transporter permease subunit [Acidobacteriota bacterium]|nr:efflux RND transporter permease subunit [Acidobacteriota bacterium]
MINRIIDFSARNRMLIVVLTLCLTLYGLWSIRQIPLDAIPDLSDAQVIIYTEWPGRSPDLIEDQITFRIVSAMLAAPHVSVVRGSSDYGVSYVYVIFDEGTDIYWGRTRVLEYMSRIGGSLPEGVTPKLGPDATGVGWAFQYALVDRAGRNNLAQLRSFNDWYLRYWLEGVPGVAEVATVGGFVKQYQVNVDPNRLLAHKLPLSKVIDAVRNGNSEVGARSLEMTGKEYLVRGRGYIHSLSDIENIPLSADENGTPVYVRDVARVELGPAMRRGIADLNGEGEVTGGTVVVRYGQNVRDVIERVKARLTQLKSSLPAGVELVTTYDRSDLIDRSIDTLRRTLVEELLIVSVVILIFLWHFPSAIIPIVTIPIAVILSFIPMRAVGVTANIMSLGGIAIAIGAMVDASIVVVEQTHKKLEHWEAEGRPGSGRQVVIDAVKEVGGPSFFSLLVIAAGFLPIFALQYQEGRLFKPLAFTKNFSMVIAALLAITLDPAIRLLLMRTEQFRFRPRPLASLLNALLVGKIHSEENHPISRPLMRIYHPVVRAALKLRWVVIVLAIAAVLLTIPVYKKLGSEFMPPLNEGSILYMPITLPGISITEAGKYLQIQDKLLRQFPEVQSVFGKIGKSDTATDPAPLSMVETTIVLKPEEQWPKVQVSRWYSQWAPEFSKPPLRRFWPERRPISWESLIGQMDQAVQIPSFANAWLFPIRTRIDMITTGIRTPVGVKIMGPNLDEIQKIGLQVEKALQAVPGTRSAFFERVTGGYYIDFEVNREQAARYNLTVAQVNDIVGAAIGGRDVTTTVEGRERYAVNVRYARGLRQNLSQLSRVLVQAPGGAQVPMGELASITVRSGAPMIKNEAGFLAGFVYVDTAVNTAGGDLGTYVQKAQNAVRNQVQLPPGYQLVWSGQYEYMERATKRLRIVVPITLLIVLLLLYFNTGSFAKTLIVMLAVPFSAIGAIWFLYLLGYNMSVAVWVGLIALLGVDAETGVFMLLYLELAFEARKQAGQMRGMADLRAAIEDGAVKRLRPKVMTVAVMFLGLVPIMWSHGAGSDVMRRIAAPMIGGIFTSFLLELLVYPVVYEIWKGFEVRRTERQA